MSSYFVPHQFDKGCNSIPYLIQLTNCCFLGVDKNYTLNHIGSIDISGSMENAGVQSNDVTIILRSRILKSQRSPNELSINYHC